MSVLRELLDVIVEACKYLDQGTAWDKAWAAHLASDARDLAVLEQAGRRQAPQSVS